MTFKEFGPDFLNELGPFWWFTEKIGKFWDITLNCSLLLGTTKNGH